MGTQPSILRAPGRSPFLRDVVGSWRSLTGGSATKDADRPTLVACSAGADSSALAIALASTPARVVIAHVVHDMRTPEAAAADRDRAAGLARLLDRPFVESTASSSGAPGNVEALLRRARHRALARMAIETGCAFVATGHQADDQVETVLMRLLRGTGPGGLRCIRPSRPLEPGVRLVRPMLRQTAEGTRSFCAACGWLPAHDATNHDLSRLRAAVRHRVAPVLGELAADLPERFAELIEMQDELAGLVAARARGVIGWADRSGGAYRWPRARVRGLAGVVLGGVVARIGGQARWSEVRALRNAIRDNGAHSATCHTGGVVWRINTQDVVASLEDQPANFL